MDGDERGWRDDNLGSSTSSRLRRESHDLPELSRNRGASVFGVVVFCLLTFAYFLVLVGAVVSVSFFAYEQNQIASKVAHIDSNSNGSCILFAGHDSTGVLFPTGPTCLAVIWGLACVAVLAFLMCLGSCLRCGINLLRRISP